MSSSEWNNFNKAVSLKSESLSKCLDFLLSEYSNSEYPLAELYCLHAEILSDLGLQHDSIKLLNSAISKFPTSTTPVVMKISIIVNDDKEYAIKRLLQLLCMRKGHKFEVHDLYSISRLIKNIVSDLYLHKDWPKLKIFCSLLLVEYLGIIEELNVDGVCKINGFVNVLHEILRVSVLVCDEQTINSIKIKVKSLIKADDASSKKISGLLKNPKSIKKVAILISGQLRGYQNALSWIRSQFNDFDIDLYIATWNKSGYRRPTIELGTCYQLNRFLDSPFVNYLSKAPEKTNEFFKNETYFTEYLSRNVTSEDIHSYYKGLSNNIKCTIHDEVEFETANKLLIKKMWDLHPIFTAHSTPLNSAKMLYLNQMAADSLKSSNLTYDLIVRIRPDGYLNDLTRLPLSFQQSIINERLVVVDSVGGFGDQLCIGSQFSVSYYCNLWARLYSKNFEFSGSVGYGTQPHLRLIDYFVEGGISGVCDPELIVHHDSTIRIGKSNLLQILKNEICTGRHNACIKDFLSGLIAEFN